MATLFHVFAVAAPIHWGFESTHSSLSGIDIANLSLCTLFYNGTDADQAYLADQIVADAHYEAGLPPLAPGEAMARGGKFFTIVHERFVCDEKMAYRNVWKGGNNFIRGNMRASGHGELHNGEQEVQRGQGI